MGRFWKDGDEAGAGAGCEGGLTDSFRSGGTTWKAESEG